MEEIFRKTKRRPSLAHKQFPANAAPIQPPRAYVPSTTQVDSAATAGFGPEHGTRHVPRSTRTPRKRFRKKVTGLFGDHTDLQKRMQKLLRPLKDDVFAKKNEDHQFTHISPKRLSEDRGVTGRVNDALDLAKKAVLEMDKGTQTSKEDNVEADKNIVKSSMSTRALASIAKWKMFSNRIGRMSPRSNELFLNEVDVCTTSPSSTKSKNRVDEPTLPRLDDPAGPQSSAPLGNAGSRVGTPAMLRRKVRRNERGYRGADVLRMRSAREGTDASGGGTRSDSPNRAEAGGLDRYLRSVGNPEVSVVRRTVSDMKEVEGAISTPRMRSDIVDNKSKSAKRRWGSDETVSNGNDQPVDALSLLIEAAQNESAEAGPREAAGSEDVPPRKAKRLRGNGSFSRPSPLRVRTLTDTELSSRSKKRNRSENLDAPRRLASDVVAKDKYVDEDSAATMDDKTDEE